LSRTDRTSEMAPLTRGATQRGGRRIRLLIADDHALLRQALRTLLDGQDGLEVVGEASNGRDAVEAAERLLPDVVLMDMVMPGLNGIEATRQITKRVPGCRILILTAYLEDERLLQALRAGANGYVVKNSDLEELLLAVRSVHRGNTYFSSAVSEEIAVNEVLMQAKQPVPRTGYDLLTNREREVLQLIAEGYSNQRIADELVISVKTVEAHKAHIMSKLHARNRTDLIRYAIKHGLVGLESPELDEPPAGARAASA
jgi:two-component system response regulator NreC